MDAQQFQDAMVAALGQVNLSAGIGQEFKNSLRQIGLPQVPPLVIAGTKIDTTENLFDHKLLLDLEFTRLGITDANSKANLLKSSLGKDHITTVENLKIPAEGDEDAYKKLFKAVQKRFGLENPEPQARAKFLYQINHQPGDDAISMAERLRRTGNLCNYGGDLDKNILEILLAKCLDKKWRMHVRTQKLDLAGALDYASQLRQDRDADKVVERYASGGRVNFTRKTKNTNKWKQNQGSNWQSSRQCTRCGKPSHGTSERCPAQGTTCSKCGFANHWASQCKTKNGKKKGGHSGHSTKKFNKFSKKKNNFHAKKVNEGEKDTQDESSEKDSFVRHVKMNNLL